MNYTKNNGNFFTFIWHIENVRLLPKVRSGNIVSPNFIVKKFLNTMWFLRLYPGGRKGENSSTTNAAACDLVWSPPSDSILREIEIEFKIMSVNKMFLFQDFPKTLDGKCLFTPIATAYGPLTLPHLPSSKSEHNALFLENDGYIVCCMRLSESQVNKNSLYMNHLYTHLLLSNRCPSFRTDIRDPKEKMFLFPNQCFARTAVQVELRKFLWSAEDFTDGEIFKQILVVTTSKITPDLMVHLSKEECKSGPIKVIIHPILKASHSPVIANCKVSVADSYGKVCHATESEYYLSATNTDAWRFEISCDCATMNKDLNSFTLCLSYIHCEITILTGLKSWIERESYEYPVNRVCKDSITSPSELEFLDLFTKKRCTDVTFQLRDKTIQAHKAILCARSPVFCAMFENDMKENETNIIKIEDIDADTLDQLLKFMYFDSIKDMDYELAMKLYEVADKYQVLTLQEKCARFILSHLTTSNVCTALCLGDTHHDKKFKNSVLNFILKHWNEILVSEEWNELFKQNVRLVAETLQEVCLKLSKFQ